MSNSYIQVPPDSSGKKMQTVLNTVDGQPVHASVVVQVSPSNPTYSQEVDAKGQALIRFAEGSATLDAFANLRTSSSSIIGGYEFSNGDMADLFSDELIGTGSVYYDEQASLTTLSVNSANSASARRTTNRYHYYQPGTGTIVLFSLAHGDLGKTNNVRRWGYYDIDDGLFFELDGTTLSVVRRSSVTGSTVEERVAQEDWNGDKLDGTGVSHFDIDITKGNLYFVDFAWLGVGPVRMGIVSGDGSRVVCHTFQNPNTHNGAYMSRGSLPVRFRNFNKGATSGTSELHVICCAVYSENAPVYTYWRFSDIGNSTPKTVTTNTPLFSIRPKLMNGGRFNRVNIYPETFSCYISGGPVKLQIIDDAELTGATWNQQGESLAEGDTTATSLSGGSIFREVFLAPGNHIIPLSYFYETHDEGYCVAADGSWQSSATLVGTKLDGTATSIWSSLSYRELR